jgi:hypothetical protein
MRVFVAALLLALSSASPTKSNAPLTRIDRAKAVGAPLLDLETEEGIYIWLQDGWFNIAAVSRAEKNIEMRVQVRSTKKLTHVEGPFAVKALANSLSLRAWVGPLPVKGRFKSDGQVTVSSTHQLFVGPYSRKAASSLSIGR